MNTYKTADDLIALFGGNVATAAEKLGVTKAVIYKWKKLERLPLNAEQAVRDWYLVTRGSVPKDWMPRPTSAVSV